MYWKSVAWDAIPNPLWKTPDLPAVTEYDNKCLRIPTHLRDSVLGALSLVLKSDMWLQDGSENIEDVIDELLSMWVQMDEGCGMIGEIVEHAREELPENWLPCNGALYNRVDYPELYSVISSTYIVDADTFRTPRILGRFTLCEGGTFVEGVRDGEEEVALDYDTMPQHRHTYQQYTFGIDIESVGIPDPTGVGLPTISRPTSIEGNGNPHNNMPPYIVVKKAIIAR